MSKIKAVKICFCDSGLLFVNCCAPIINGTKVAMTAVDLMRSRYSAYAINNVEYILSSWHSSTRPVSIDLESNVQWIRLKIISSEQYKVKFIAIFRIAGKAEKMQETSHFVFEAGKWFYVDGVI